MKILVTIKQVVDHNIKVRAKPSKDNVDIEYAKMSINPFDERAIEEAIRLKEQNIATEIIALSIGSEKVIEQLRVALAKGVDRAILVHSSQMLENIYIAKIIKQIYLKEKPQLILSGKQAIDDDAMEIPQMVAGMLDLPQIIAVSKLIIDNNKVIATKEIEQGQEMVSVYLPCVISTDLSINEPRFVKLPQLILARKKEIEIIPLDSLNIIHQNLLIINDYKDNDIKKNCNFLNNVEELAKLLKNETINNNV